MTHRTTTARDTARVEIPTFGRALRRLRDDRGVSREQLAYTAGVSASYVTHLEKGDRDRPARPVVEALLRCLDRIRAISAAERRHVFDLAGLSLPGEPTVPNLRAAITGEQRHALHLFRPHLAAYVDQCGNVLEANAEWDAALPGIRQDANLFRWMFGNALARQHQVDWDTEARKYIRWLRATYGRNAADPALTALVDELSGFADFRRIWSEDGVDFPPSARVQRLRDPATGRVRCFQIQTAGLHCTAFPNHIAVILGLEIRRSGHGRLP
ncbi:XRE family transcriptional regulator [Nocardia yunnanensis]|uniref:XRE family transcriptional regulator n=1 Tax=Nocardia yunnanensis TaxID=2382165 RepID=A0A386ZFS8_9NOCA|nr:helix-turn-helix domain-containing protein [Nocardia yunnanensis]AYF76742.1 XRE family transcriptional regulator [Nocardia yunnanensis]